MSNLVKTNIEWVGYTQSNWKIGKILQFFYEGKNKNVGVKNKNLLSLSYGSIVEKDINTSEGLLPASFSTYNIVDQGDIIIRPTDLQNDKVSLRTGLVKEKGIITSAYIDLKPYEGVNSNFFHKVLHAYDVCKVFYNMGSGVRQGIGFADIANLVVFVPPLSEQKRIADFLDGKGAQIDEITKDLEEKIDKLEDIKRSIIFESVTKGIGCTNDLKDSHIPWIGVVPSNWKIRRGKYFLQELSRKFDKEDEVITCFRDGQVTLRRNRREEGFTVSDKEIGYQGILAGDLVVHGMDGFAGAIGISDSNGKGSPVLIVMDTSQNKKYLVYQLRTYAMMEVFASLSTGIRVRSCDLNFRKLGELPYLLPPLSEQKRIADFLDGKCAQIDEITKATRQEIETLKQYKQSLIYEYVTGKKEVPNEQD